jgi:hypothetical protein
VEGLEDRLVLSQVGLTVSSLADAGPGTLRAAILAADAGKPSDKFTIGFAVTGTIGLLSPLPDLNNSIAIQGPGASDLTVRRDDAVSFSSPIVTVDADQTASISGVTFANGNAGGIFNGPGGTLTVSNSNLFDNSAADGGAINNWVFATLTLINCNLFDNTAVVNGGAIQNYGTLTVAGSAVSGNVAQHDGGGIWNAGTLTVSNSTLSGNGARGDAGGAILNDGTLSLANSTVAGNFAAIGGGILNNTGGVATIQQDSRLSGNTAASGGGIDNGGTLTVRGSTLSGNTATDFDFGGHHFPGRGGGIDNFGVATIQDSVLSGDTGAVGGGIFNEAIATLDVRGSTFTGDTASDSGGALDNLGTATIQESTISGNAAGSEGGGIFNDVTGLLAVKDSTVTGNTAPEGADLFALGSVTLDDSTVGVIDP